MKVTGLITEYNPFHNGHLYHIQQAKELTGADAIIAVMSGNFVQRGAPAILSKYLRATCALLSGVSAVIELPVCYSSASAEYFAMGAVSLLNKLNCVDAICFGSECGDITVLEEIAEIITEEPDTYRVALKDALKSGLSFPSARQQALKKNEAILSLPNNILGIEYLKALKRLDSHIKAYTIPRIGAGYHNRSIEGTIGSASGIRANIDDFQRIQHQLPTNCHSLIQEAYHSCFPVHSNDFSLLLKAKLLTETSDSLMNYADVSRELASRIINRRNDFINLEQFCETLKTKEVTYSRISRSLFHILLGITKQDVDRYLRSGFIFYARILGFRQADASLLGLMKQQSQIPLITRLSQRKDLDFPGRAMMDTDLYASDLYESVVTERFQTPFVNERQRSVIKLPLS